MENYEFWIMLLFGLCGLVALILALRDSRRIRRIEGELTNELDVSVNWSRPDAQGNTTCRVTAMLYPVTEVRVKLPFDEWFIEHLDPHVSQSRQFRAVNSGISYRIQFRDPATGRKHTEKRVVRFS